MPIPRKGSCVPVQIGFFFALGTFFSRLSGLLRESVIAGVFGASIALDAFLIANRIPNMLRELFAEGALGSSFTKVFSELWEKDQHRALRLLWDALLFFSLASLGICALGMLGAPWLVDMMTLLTYDGPAGENSFFVSQARGLTALLFPFIGFMMIASVAGGALHQKGRFLLSALCPIALNLGYLLGATFFARLLTRHGPDWIEQRIAGKAITGLAVGVLCGGLMQLCLQFGGLWKPFVAGRRFSGFSSFCGWSPELRRVLTLMAPMVIASGAGQINVLVNSNFATSLGPGAVAWLSFAFRLLQLPVGVFAIAVSSAALPAFSRLSASKAPESVRQLSKQLMQSCELVLWLMGACFCLIATSGEEMVRFLYQQGAFTEADTRATSDVLFYYSFGLIAYGLIKVLSSWYYARDRTQWAMKVGLISIGANFILNHLLVAEFGVNGLAMTASGVLSLNALGLIWGLRQDQLVLANSSQLMRGLLSFALTMGLCLGAGYSLRYFIFPLMAASGCHIKVASVLNLFLSAGLVFSLFGAMICLRLGYRPLQALRKLRQHRP